MPFSQRKVVIIRVQESPFLEGKGGNIMGPATHWRARSCEWYRKNRPRPKIKHLSKRLFVFVPLIRDISHSFSPAEKKGESLSINYTFDSKGTSAEARRRKSSFYPKAPFAAFFFAAWSFLSFFGSFLKRVGRGEKGDLYLGLFSSFSWKSPRQQQNEVAAIAKWDPRTRKEKGHKEKDKIGGWCKWWRRNGGIVRSHLSGVWTEWWRR